MTLIQDSHRLVTRFRDIKPSDIALVADFDLTLGIKPDKNFHHVQLCDVQYQTLARASGELGATIILTARGEESTLSGIFGERALLPITLASNSGHHVLLDASRQDDARIRIPINGIEDAKASAIVTDIHRILGDIGNRFNNAVTAGEPAIYCEIPVNGHGKIILDPREICGAVVFEGIHENDSAAVREYFDASKKARLNGSSHLVLTADKYMADGHGAINGYIDIKPVGMDKGHTSLAIVANKHFEGRIHDNTQFIVAGDSAPDLSMMKAMTDRYGQDRVTCVWVGEDPAAAKFVAENPMPIWQLRGDQHTAIPQMYDIIGAAAVRPKQRLSLVAQ